MADKTISQLNPLTVPITSATLFEVEHLGVSYKATGAQLQTFLGVGGGSGNPVIGSNAGIMWGANIHSGRGGVYNTLGNTATMALAASVGLKIVRTDLYDASSGSQAILTAALAAAATANIKVCPILMADIDTGQLDGYADETAAYNAGHAQGLTYGTNFQGQVSIWEVGNEWNGKFGGFTNFGANASDYNGGYLIKVRGLARGFIEGLKSGDPACKVSFGSNSALSCWGWTDALYAAGVRWDITSVHFYANNGTDDIQNLFLGPGTTDLLPLMRTKYGVPSWLTEFNYWPGNAAESTKATYLTSIMPVYAGIALTKFLEAVIFYELLDEGTDGGAENSFGIASGPGVLQASGTAIQTYLAAHPSVQYR